LLGKGADAKATSETGSTPLIEAINAGNADVTKLLVAAGADVNPNPIRQGSSPIHQAIAMGANDVSMKRYDHAPAADVAAALKRRLATLDAVLAAGAKIWTRDDRGQTPLEVAINGGVIEILTRVLDGKPDLDAADAAGKTPLQYLAGDARLQEKDLLPLAKLLVARGAKHDATAADIATQRGFAALAAAIR
jgi:cytohesin